MCKMFKLAKEEADELAELDCSNIITASKEACRNNTKNVPFPSVATKFFQFFLTSVFT